MRTAVEWFVYEIFTINRWMPLTPNELNDIVNKAKEMDKKQHGETWNAALKRYEVRAGNYMRAYEDFDDYYNETFKSE
jgi:hypothetical protein